MQKEIEDLRNKYRAGRSELFRSVNWELPARTLLDAHTSLVDGLMAEIYEISCLSASRVASRSSHSGLAIVATGGYGRRELNPFSDIDIAFVPSEEEDPWVEALVHTAFKLVMDAFLSLRDVHVGYSFRPIAEAGSWDVATKTSLLDLRYICGDRSLADGLALRIRHVLSPLDLMVETAVPQRSSTGLIHMVEPHLKEGPGSLRDLHRARWIFKLMYEVEDSGLKAALVHRAGISERRLREVDKASEWFWRARNWLHLKAGKLSDVLITNYQDRISQDLGPCSTQRWMSEHHSHSETLARFRETAVQTLLLGPLVIEGTKLENGSLHLNGQSAVEMFRISQRYALPIGLADLLRLGEERESALSRATPDKKETWAFNQILGQNQGTAATLRSLADCGYLDRFLPGYSEVLRFVPPDPAHRFTVGEHSFRMIEHLERLRSGADPGEQRFAELLDQCSHYDMLCLACLLHDAGKLVSGSDHSESGANLARTVSTRLELPPEKGEMLDLLIRKHLLLVRTARLHDVKLANIIQKVAEQVPSLEALRHLYLFTYIDTSAVAEKNWTSMDFRDLEDLYMKMQEFYSRDSADAVGPDSAREDRTVLVRQKLASLYSRTEPAVLKHCDAMPAGYILNTPLQEIAFHSQLLEKLESERVVLDVYNRPGDDYTELTLCAFDDPAPGMLAKITGVLYGCGVDIHRAQAFTIDKEQPLVLDTLWVRANGMQISENKARRIKGALEQVLTGSQPIAAFLAKAGKKAPDGIPLESIDLSNDLSEEHTVVHIVARDLQGLLYIMTRSLSDCGLHIHSAKIATWNARAENNFYVTVRSGGQIPDLDLPVWTKRLSDALTGADQGN